MERLIVIEGRTSPEEVEIGTGILIGRAREADLRLFDETASRRHALVGPREGRTVLEDLDSANGVLLNGEAVEGKAALFDGDEIRIGEVRMRFLSAAGADRETVAAAERVEAAVDPDAADPAADLADTASSRRLRLVCDGATACADAASEGEVPGILLALAAEAFEPDRATVSLLRPGGATAVVAAHPGGASAPTSGTLRRRVVEEGEAVLVRDALDSDARGGSSRSIVASRFRSTLAAPLRTSEGTLGYVVVEALEPGRYGEQDLRALAAAARQAALALRNLRRLSGARAEAGRLARGGSGAAGAPDLLGEAEALEEVRARIGKAAAVDSPVLVIGETGTGKELVARLLHAQGPRSRQPFVALNCAAIVEGLLESELFGHEKGAFTGATARHEGRVVQAGKGTLFLDEVGDLPAALQAKLLRVLSEGTFTRVGGRDTLTLACRVVAATNRDLAAMVEEGSFRQDLYYRLAVIEIGLPPLRERGRDVELLAEAAIERLSARLGRRPPRLGADAREVLARYAWPGNVRELFNVLERALVLHAGDTLSAADLPAEVRRGRDAAAGEADAAAEATTLREAEHRAVLAAIRAAGGKKGLTAEILGVSWPTLNRKIREYGLEREVERAREGRSD